MHPSTSHRLLRTAAAWLLGLLLVVPAHVVPAYGQRDPRLEQSLEKAGIEEQLGERIAADVVLRDEAGREVTLGTYLGGERPVLLNFVYHSCPMLCSLVLDGLSASLQEMEWTPGDQFDIVTVSFEPKDTPELAAQQKAKYIELAGKPEAAPGWHFLTGTPEAIETLTKSAGFRYAWVEQQQSYAHPAALIFLSGSGVISRYLHGLDYKPRDVRNALVEASEGKIGNPLDQVLLYCFQYDPNANSYVLQATNLMKIAGIFTALAVGAFLFLFWRREVAHTRA